MKTRYAVSGDRIEVARVGFHGIRIILPDHDEIWEIDADAVSLNTVVIETPIEFLKKQTLWFLLKMWIKAGKTSKQK